MNDAIPYPSSTSDPHVVPHCYVVIKRTQRCACCGAKHEWSEPYAQTYLRPSMGMGRHVTNLHRIDQPKYRLPIIQHAERREEVVPFCHSCYQPTLEHAYNLLEPPAPEPGRIMSAAAPAAKAPPRASSPKAKPSVDSIMEMLDVKI